MSQASKVLKEIAAGPEYAALAEAMEKGDYDTIAKSYGQLNGIIEGRKKEILEKIDGLLRQNKDGDRQQFMNAFAVRVSTTLPQWHRLITLLQEQKIADGEVIGAGSKGDPMVRTADGKLTIISGLTAEKGSRVKFRVSREGEKVNFGQAVEFTPDFFYILLNQRVLVDIRDRFNAVDERLKTVQGEMTPGLMNEILQELEKVRELDGGLRQDEKDKVNLRILNYRKRLLNEYGIKLALEFIERQETEEIKALCQGDGEKANNALAVPGLFRYQSHRAVKAELFDGKELKGYVEMLGRLENFDSMDGALKLMEFKSGFEEVEPAAREYLEKMDTMFERLHRKARTVVAGVAEGQGQSIEEIRRQIEAAFTGKGAGSEMRGVFRNPGEFFGLRESLIKLRTMLGNDASQAGESAIRPYLNHKITQAFGR